MKSIAIVQPSFSIGGLEKALINMLKQLDYRTVDVDLFVLEPGGPLQKEVPEQVHVIGMPKRKRMRRLILANIKKFHLLRVIRLLLVRLNVTLHPEKAPQYYELYGKMADLFTDKQYDTVISYNGWGTDVDLCALYQLRGNKRILWNHLSRDPYPIKLWLWYRFDRIVYVSDEAMRRALYNHPELTGQSVAVYNCPNRQEVLAKSQDPVDIIHDGRPVLATVGRLSPEKGFDMIPEIVARLKERGLDVIWYLIGDGSCMNDLKKRCRQWGVSDNVVFTGELENPYPYVNACDIYVQPSYSEAFCTTTAEAKYLCKPTVVTDVCGMREQFCHMENGLIAKDISPAGLCEQIEYLIRHPEVRSQFTGALSTESDDVTRYTDAFYRVVL